MKSNEVNGATKKIAVVAHEDKKTALIEWAYLNKNILSKHNLIATGTTGKILEGTLNVPVKQLLHGPSGGDKELSAMITDGELDAIVFFWNPTRQQPRHETDIKALINIAVTSDILIACNRAKADFV